jgi:hypothetical protein
MPIYEYKCGSCSEDLKTRLNQEVSCPNAVPKEVKENSVFCSAGTENPLPAPPHHQAAHLQQNLLQSQVSGLSADKFSEKLLMQVHFNHSGCLKGFDLCTWASFRGLPSRTKIARPLSSVDLPLTVHMPFHETVR